MNGIHPSGFSGNLRGILAIMASNLLFLANDSIVKIVSEAMPLGQIIFVRGMMATAVLVPIVIYTGAHHQVKLLASPALGYRTVGEVLSAVLYLLAVINMPIANASLILQTVPLALTAAGALLFGEHVGWRRWTAIAVGFLGVAIVIRPGVEGFNFYGLVALSSVAFIILRDVGSRMMPRALPGLLVALVTAFAVCLSGPILAFLSGEVWVTPTLRQVSFLAVAVVFLIGAYVTAVDFMRHGDIAVVAPFRYSLIIWAMLAGYLIWGDKPDAPMLIGAGIIIATGVYIFRRESRLKRNR